jgi:hypothetical protein
MLNLIVFIGNEVNVLSLRFNKVNIRKEHVTFIHSKRKVNIYPYTSERRVITHEKNDITHGKEGALHVRKKGQHT